MKQILLALAFAYALCGQTVFLSTPPTTGTLVFPSFVAVDPSGICTNQDVFFISLSSGNTFTCPTLGGLYHSTAGTVVGGTAVWGGITGSLAVQSDLTAALATKEPSIPQSSSNTFWDGLKAFRIIVAGDLPANITSNTSGTAAALANTPTPCPAGMYVSAFSAAGVLTCGTPATGGATWGGINGTLASQTDLNAALNAKEPSVAVGTLTQFWDGLKAFRALNSGDIPNNAANTTGTAAALANTPTPCPAGLFVTTLSAAGVLTCATPTGGAWGGITGTLSAQTDLSTALALLAPKLNAVFTGTMQIPTGAQIGTSVLPTGFQGNTAAYFSGSTAAGQLPLTSSTLAALTPSCYTQDGGNNLTFTCGSGGSGAFLGTVSGAQLSSNGSGLTTQTFTDATQAFNITDEIDPTTGAVSAAWFGYKPNPGFSFHYTCNECTQTLTNKTITSALFQTVTLGTSTLNVSRLNDGTNGTALLHLVNLTSTGARTVAITNQTDIYGVCAGNCGLSGSATITIAGQISVILDSAPTAIGDIIESSTVNPGNGVDVGPTDLHNGHVIVGRVANLTLQGGGGYLINLQFVLSIPSNVATATALAAAPSNCTAGMAPTGVNASGAAQNCTTYAHATILQGNLSNGTVAASSTQFLGFVGSIPNAATQPTTISTRQAMIPFVGIARNFALQITGAQPASGSLVCTVQLTHAGSTAATTLTVTFAASAAAGTVFDTTDTATNAIFDSYAVSCVNNATAVSATLGNVVMVIQ